MKLYFYIFEKVAVFCFAGEAGEAGDHPLSSTLFARGGVMSLATVISGYSGGGQHCPEFTEFTEASSTADTAGMSRHRLAPYTVHYLKTLLILAISGS